MGQCSHESNGFKALKENLNYSAEGLRKIFPKYFPTDAVAQQYARNPQKIANKVYSSRMGNGDEASGDGWRFSGSGAIQLTGRSNYKEFSDFIGESEIMTNPELVATKYPLSSAGFFFNKNNLWTICDRGVDDVTITAVSKRVNGGTIGLPHRIEETHKYYQLLKA
jgi:putative chitinase